MARKKKGFLSSKVKRSRKVSTSLMTARRRLRANQRYKRDAKFFRPKLMVTKDGKVYASPKSGGSYTVNPRRKTMARRRRKVSRRRITRRRYRRNPARGGAIVRQAFSRKNILNVAGLGVGFIGGIKAQKYINNVEALMQFRRFTGAIPFILGTLLAVRSRRESIKSVGAGLSLSGLYDLVTQNIPQLNLSPVEGVDLDDDTNYNTGTAIDVDGTAIDVEGDDDVVVSADNTIDVVGDASPYAMV